MTESVHGAGQKNWWTRTPLSLRIIVGVVLGTLLGIALRKYDSVPGNHDAVQAGISLGDICMLVITLLKTLATPLIFFAVLDTFLRIKIPARKGVMLLCISAVNAAVAILIGLSAANYLRTGEQYRETFKKALEKRAETPSATSPAVPAAAAPMAKADVAAPAKKAEEPPSLDLVKTITGYIPENLVDPFLKNNVISTVFLALLVGGAMRVLKNRNLPETAEGLRSFELIVIALYRTCTQVLDWLVQLVPIAVFGVAAKVVAKTGPDIFKMLLPFLLTILAGLFIHAVIYYSILLRVVGGMSPIVFFRGAFDAIVTALSCGSSLATLPVTLRCLNDKLKISPASARLAACVGTNLNHDGIILYEAAATMFIAQGLGFNLSIGQQVVVAFASAMAGIGIAGVPEAGLITLQVVLIAAGIKPEIAVTLAALLLPVDWIIGRCRAATNVVSDMTVATLLDRLDPPEQSPVTIGVPQEEAVQV